MTPSILQSRFHRWVYTGYVSIFFIYLLAPLFVVAVFAFNDSLFPSLPWNGFTLDWFIGDSHPRLGVFNDKPILQSIGISALVAVCVSVLAISIGTSNAFLFEREEFPFKNFLYMLMLTPLVIPGVILGISILLTSTTAGNYIEDTFGVDIELFRPSYWLVIFGQFSFGATYVMLLVAARLKKFDRTLEEAALSLKATRLESILYVTIPFLRPAIIGAFVVAFILSFSNINTTIFLVGSDPTLPIDLYSRIRFSSTPVLNAVSFLVVLVISFLALINFFVSGKTNNRNGQD